MSKVATAEVQTPSISEDLAEIVEGLLLPQKTISPKFFYDDIGSKLFDDICELPEYYPTRTELAIMRDNIDEIVELIGPRASLIEFGSGSSLKTRTLLAHLRELAVYVPVDISREHLQLAASGIKTDFPEIEVLPVAADFTQQFRLPNPKVMPLRNIVYFPGSTIGNFSVDAALELLKVMHHEAGKGGAMLIGVDLQKDVRILEEAYNDAAGVTAEFNLNVLRRINNEFGSDFDLQLFEHRAIYDYAHGRIEMYLDSLCEQTVSLAGETIQFEQGEAILTEHSHKYTMDGFATMAKTAGFEIKKVWVDAERLFSVQYCERS